MKITDEEFEALYDLLIAIVIGFAIESAIFQICVWMGVLA